VSGFGENYEAERMKGNIGNLMKQAQAMQASVQKAQAEIATLEVEGAAGGGMVRVTMTGKHEVKRVQLEPAVIGEDREMLEDLIAAAINDAVHKVEARVQEKMAGLMTGVQLPPGMKMPF
jgi:DNA-binding YbaB/EbfC family protein